MKTGSLGTFVISWSQTEVDGLKAAPLDVLAVGTTWRWSGAAVRVDGPQGVLLLEGAEGAADIRKRAARMVRRLVGVAVGGEDGAEQEQAESLPEQGFIVTDGHQSFSVTLIPVPDTGARLLMLVGELPPVDQDLWVVRTAIDRTHSGGGARTAGGVICFTPETRLATPQGPRMIRDLRQGDLIETRDNGPQEVLWSGHRRMSGARLFAMPEQRPIRLRRGALGVDRPEDDLIVSPEHRVLVKGRAARDLWGEDEVLVRAADLVGDRFITVDHSLRETWYIHLMLERHEVIWANGLEVETFHPGFMGLDHLNGAQRDLLFDLRPELSGNPDLYGPPARRMVSRAEAAILLHGAPAYAVTARH